MITTNQAIIAAAVLALALLPAFVVGQATTCSCAPTVYRFRLDFDRTCEDNTYQLGKTAGIDRSFCRNTGDGGDDGADDGGGDGGGDGSDTGSPPVTLASFQILELDSSLSVMKQYFRDGLDLIDGDTFEYTSIVTTAAEEDGAVAYPAALQMAMTALSADGTTEVVSQFILTFTNLCETPVFSEGDSVSWVVLENFEPARPELCSGAPPRAATSASSSNDEISLIPVVSSRASNSADVESSMSISMSFRRLDFMEWAELVNDENAVEQLAEKRSIKKGLDRSKRLRRRRMQIGR